MHAHTAPHTQSLTLDVAPARPRLPPGIAYHEYVDAKQSTTCSAVALCAPYGASRTLPDETIKIIRHNIRVPVLFLSFSRCGKSCESLIIPSKNIINFQRSLPFGPRCGPRCFCRHSAILTEPVLPIILPQERLVQHCWPPIRDSGSFWMRSTRYSARTPRWLSW